jgi:ribosome maturation factor RimP
MSSTPAGAATKAWLREVIEPVVTAVGLCLEEVRSEPAGGRRLVRVIVDADDRPGGGAEGVTLDDVAAVSQAISARLDDADAPLGASYVLEVTSPGVDRPLTVPRHWRRARGRLVKVKLKGDGRTEEFVGRVAAADEASASLDVDGVARSVRYDDVAVARVQVEFGRPAGDESELDGEIEDGSAADAADEAGPHDDDQQDED